MLTLHERNGLENHAREDALPLIDAHHHLWNLNEGHYPWLQDEYRDDFFLGDYHAIRQNFRAEEFLRMTLNQRVIGSVHVEAERSREEQVAETQWLHRVHERFGFPNAVVAHAWFHRDDCAEILAQHARFPLVRGIRSKPVTSASPGRSVAGQPGTMQDRSWLDGFALLEQFNLSWDLRVPPWHLPEAAEVAAAFPRIRIALNHAGFAWDRSVAGLRRWRGWMETLAAQPNVHVKLSEFGLKDEPWDYESNRKIVEDVVAIFGHERCMFASNYPVASLRASYDTIADGLARMLKPLGREAQERVFYKNAQRFYRIEA
jgi:predicted TIM-barrel fold metal-dependent hydrolase